MTIKEIAYRISNEALTNKRPISKLQEIRAKYLNLRPNTWHLFSEKSIKPNENYAFHSGGRKEFQFNIGGDWINDRTVFRYGLAFSLNEDRTLHDSKAEFRPKIERFNNFILKHPNFFDGYSMWYYSNGEFGEFYNAVKPIDSLMFQSENFIFIGKFISKSIEEINLQDINDILKSFDYLIDGYEEVEFEKEIIEKRISRLTWNTNGWVKPSGSEGKSKNKNTHEGTFGYGHEEWLLDISKIIDGYHYGFLEPIRKQQSVYLNKTYDVWLYTIDNISKKRYWVGEINKVEVIDSKEAERIKEIYVKNGWHQEMESQIIECEANAEGFSDWKGVELFNIRFLPSDLNFNSDYYELPKENKIYELSRYNFANYSEELRPNKAEKGFAFNSDHENEEDNDDTTEIGTTRYNREPKAIEVTYVHKAISDDLKAKLKEKFGKKNVKTEVNAGYGNNKIDLVVKHQDEFIFYEIKSYNSSRTSIREALGQLLEYCSWINTKNATKLVVVSQLLGDTEDAKIYIKHIRDTFGIPIYFQTFDLTNKELSEEY